MQKLLGVALAMVTALPMSLYAQYPSPPLTNKDVVSMIKAGLTPQIVSAKIKSSHCDFDTAPTVLEELKKAGVPDPVILAMVEAPRDAKAADTKPANAKTVYVKCNYAPFEIHSTADFASLAVATATCNQALTVLDDTNKLYWRVKTDQGAVGYVHSFAVSGEKQTEQSAQTNPLAPASSAASLQRNPTLPPNTLRAIAWRGVPWATTSYYQQPGSSSTDCTGSGQWLGDIYQSNLSCTGSYTPSQSVPINWYHYTIYNLVETSDSYLVLSCTSNWRWSKCSYFVPGSSFSYEYRKGQVWVTGQRGGKSKEESLKYDIVDSQPKPH